MNTAIWYALFLYPSNNGVRMGLFSFLYSEDSFRLNQRQKVKDFFIKFKKKVTFCGLPHGADA